MVVLILWSTGTAYAATVLSVPQGGTFKSSFTPFSIITGGTTSTGALQTVSGVGTSTQVLTSNGPGALPTWQAAGTASPLTTKGDLYTYSTVNARLPVGSDGQILSSDSTQTTGIKWIAAPTTTAIGGTVTSGTAGSILFINPSATLAQDNSNFFYDSTNKKLLVGANASTGGNASVATILAVGDVNGEADITNVNFSGTSTTAGMFRNMTARGSKASPSALQSGDRMGGIVVDGYGTSQWPSSASGLFGFYAAENFTNSANGTMFQIETTPVGTTTRAKRFTILDSGFVGIGTVTPSTDLDVTHNQNGATSISISNLTSGTTARSLINILAETAGATTFSGTFGSYSDGYSAGTLGADVPGNSVLGTAGTPSSGKGNLLFAQRGANAANYIGFYTNAGSAIDSTSLRMTILNNGYIGMGVVTPLSPLSIAATLNSSLTAQQIGANYQFTGSGSQGNGQSGMQIAFLAGYSGVGNTYTIQATNAGGSTSTSFGGASSGASYRSGGNRAIDMAVTGSNAGNNVAGSFQAVGSTGLNVGLWGSSTYTGAGVTNVGVSGFGLGGSSNSIGGYFALADYGSSAPNWVSAALVADNGSTSSPIFLGRVNGITKFTIDSAGATVIANTLTSTGIRESYVAKTANYTATATDYEVDCTANTFTVTLPNSTAGNFQLYVVTNSGAGVITVTTVGGAQIVGNNGVSTTATIAAGSSSTFHATGTGYRIN